MVTHKPSYEYAPLEGDAIRILILLPALTYDDDLEGRLIHEQALRPVGGYDDPYPIAYDAVSYTWGEPVFSHQLECEGAVLQVTASVDNLLRRLRKSHRPRIRWLDQVCINQENEKEKSAQVKLMGQIFSRARKVHVWLGDTVPQDRIEWVLNFFGDAASFGPQGVRSAEHRSSFQLEHDSDKVIDRFLSRPWFRRRWVLQEVMLAQAVTVWCGRIKMPWQGLIHGSRSLNRSAKQSLSPVSIRSLDTLTSFYQPPNELLDLMFTYDQAMCYDPRDRLFALYGMTSEFWKPPVDYGIPWADLCLQLASSCVNGPDIVSLLQHLTAFGSTHEKVHGLPSWIPRWNGARRSVRRFACERLYHPFLECGVSPKSSKELHLRLTKNRERLIIVSSDVWTLNQQPEADQRNQVTEPIGFERLPTSPMTYKDIVVLFSRCLRTVPQEIGGNVIVEALAEILGAAVMDMRAHLAARPYVSHYEGEGLLTEDHHFPYAEPGAHMYETQLEVLTEDIRQILNKAIPGHVFYAQRERWDTHVSEEYFTRSQIKPLTNLVRFLKDYRLFYMTLQTNYGDAHLSGITTCQVEEGDFVLRHDETWKRGEPPRDTLTPATTAFLLRPFENESDQESTTYPRFRFIGLCFIAQANRLGENWSEDTVIPDHFVIV